jgi:hypothetical protein
LVPVSASAWRQEGLQEQKDANWVAELEALSCSMAPHLFQPLASPQQGIFEQTAAVALTRSESS